MFMLKAQHVKKLVFNYDSTLAIQNTLFSIQNKFLAIA